MLLSHHGHRGRATASPALYHAQPPNPTFLPHHPYALTPSSRPPSLVARARFRLPRPLAARARSPPVPASASRSRSRFPLALPHLSAPRRLARLARPDALALPANSRDCRYAPCPDAAQVLRRRMPHSCRPKNASATNPSSLDLWGSWPPITGAVTVAAPDADPMAEMTRGYFRTRPSHYERGIHAVWSGTGGADQTEVRPRADPTRRRAVRSGSAGTGRG
jgi:hypothetical protein